MTPDNFGNQGTGWEWERCIQEPTGDPCFLVGANSMPNQNFGQPQVNNMAAGTIPEDRSERKKRTDKAYRDRCREDNKRQEDELKRLSVENASLKDENESLVKENDTILNPELELAVNVINQLKSENRYLKGISDNQIIRLDALTEKIASHDKLKSLNDEVAQLRENAVQDPRMLEKKQLLEESLRLEKENSLLDLQNQSYCMMIKNKRHPGEDEAE